MKSTLLANSKPNHKAPLDRDFTPFISFITQYENLIEDLKLQSELFHIALERQNSYIHRIELKIISETKENSSYKFDTEIFIERTIKFILWAFGGHTLYISGQDSICQKIMKEYSPSGKRSFDIELMSKVYNSPFAVKIVSAEKMPQNNPCALKIGGHLDGDRIGFDLGASDYKISAISNGELKFTTEIPWTPVQQKDPNYHFQKIEAGLKEAATHLPKVDSIGGSSAGILINNQFRIASLFRSVSPDDFIKKVQPLFADIESIWKVPVTVINDGDVTALAGAMSLNTDSILGMAMGSSEATGFINSEGKITDQLNELAFAPVDISPTAVADEWSKDVGVGALYFSQQAVNKLAPKAKISFPKDMPLPERLVKVQELADSGNKDALKIFETIGVYLGYTIPLYKRFYGFNSVLILGRVTSGSGGELIIKKAKEILNSEFPKLAEEISLHVPDEASRRVGQAVAAASLPQIVGVKK